MSFSATGAADSEPIGVAVIGAGYWGPNLIRSFRSSSSFRLRPLCDLDTERAERALGGYSIVERTADLNEVLADPEVATVAIATPAGTQVPVAMAAVAAGEHVLVEKPLAVSLHEGRRLVEEADARGLALMRDHTYCDTPAMLRVRELLHPIELGELHYLDSVRINLGPDRIVSVLSRLAGR